MDGLLHQEDVHLLLTLLSRTDGMQSLCLVNGIVVIAGLLNGMVMLENHIDRPALALYRLLVILLIPTGSTHQKMRIVLQVCTTHELAVALRHHHHIQMSEQLAQILDSVSGREAVDQGARRLFHVEFRLRVL